MQIALTGATGFLGRYVVAQLAAAGHECRCWYRAQHGAAPERVRWLRGELDDPRATQQLVAGADAVVHAALHHPGGGYRGGEGDLVDFVQRNIVGTIRLVEAARAAGVARFVFISTCAVHERILDDRPLDENHPLFPLSQYGAHKAALEKFVHSYGLGAGYPICTLRPTGIYGLAEPAPGSKWFDLVRRVVAGQAVHATGGGKEVHALDVARAVEVLLGADAAHIAGRAFNCYDQYISDFDVAVTARTLSGSDAQITGAPKQPLHQIDTSRLRGLGMTFGGRKLFEETIRQLVAAVRS